MQEIEPERLYSVKEAAALVPSARGGHVSPRTLLRWRKQGLEMVARRSGSKTYWFVRGSDLLRLLARDGTSPPVGRPETQQERKEAQQRALRTLRALGLKV